MKTKIIERSISFLISKGSTSHYGDVPFLLNQFGQGIQKYYMYFVTISQCTIFMFLKFCYDIYYLNRFLLTFLIFSCNKNILYLFLK